MNDDDILETQRALRQRLFEGESAIRWRPARELAAQLLLYLDDARMCWQLTADWTRTTLDADRADGGYGGYFAANGAAIAYKAMAESQRLSMPLPPMLGHSFEATEPSIRALWHHTGPTPFSEISQDRAMTPSTRRALLGMGTAAKLALTVSDGGRPIGLLCADWHRAAPRWHADTCNEMAQLSPSTLGPILGAAMRLTRVPTAHASAAPRHAGGATQDDLLTPAEARVARLVAKGLSYKEVARELGRSLSTIDHQLRSIRQKLGVSSTSRLVRMLNERGVHDEH